MKLYDYKTYIRSKILILISFFFQDDKLIELVENFTECFKIRINEEEKPIPNNYIEPMEEILKRKSSQIF